MKLKKHVLMLAIVGFLMVFPLSVFATYPYGGIYGQGTYADPVDYIKVYTNELRFNNGISEPTARFSIYKNGNTMAASSDTSQTLNLFLGDKVTFKDLSTLGSGSSLSKYDFQVTHRGGLVVRHTTKAEIERTTGFTFDDVGEFNIYLSVMDNTPMDKTDYWGNWSYNGSHRAIGENPGPTSNPADDFYGYWYFVEIKVIVSPHTLTESHYDIDTGLELSKTVYSNITNSEFETYSKTPAQLPGYAYIGSRAGYTWIEADSSSMSAATVTNRRAKYGYINYPENKGSNNAFHWYYYKRLPGLFANFAIKHNGSDYTDKELIVPNLPITASLQDLSSGDNITSWKWEYKAPDMPSFQTFSSVQEPTFSLDEEKTYTFKLTITDKNNNTASETHDITVSKGIPSPAGEPPIAVITGPRERMAGESITFSGASSQDPDGTIVNYIWNIPGANHIYTEPSKRTTRVWYPSPGEYDLDLTVVDNDGLTGDCMTSIMITPPTPTAAIDITGNPKVNRKVTVSGSNSYSPAYYPINKYSWTMSNVADARYIGSFVSEASKDMIFKMAQAYRFDLRVDNTYGLTDTEAETVTIVPDIAPIADFSIATKVVRDPNDSNYSTITATNLSRSTDGDPIDKTVMFYAYDSNNDGNFDNETWYLCKDGAAWAASGLTYAQLNSLDLYNLSGAGNPANFVLKTKNVGKYKFEAKTIEDIPAADTIPSLLSDTDYQTGISLTTKPLNTKVVEVLNTAPTVSFEVKKKKPLDLIIVTDYSSVKMSQLQSQLAILGANLRPLNIDINITVITNKVPVAVQTSAKYQYYRDLHFIRHIEQADGTNYSVYPPGEMRDEGFRLENITEYERPASEIPVRVSYSGYAYAGTYNYSNTSSEGSGVYYRVYYTGGYYDVSCANYSNTWGFYRNYTSWHVENVYPDPTYIKGSYIGTDTFTVYNMDVDGIKNIPLRADSDRYVMLLSDGMGKDYSKAFGENFTIGNLTQSLKDYLKINKMKVYSVLDAKSLYSTLTKEIIVDVSATRDMLLQRTASGDVWVMNDSGKTYKIDESVFGKVKSVLDPNLIVFENGSVKCFDGETLKPFPVSNITAACSPYAGLTIVASGGNIYWVDGYNYTIKNTMSGFGTITDLKNPAFNSQFYVLAGGAAYRIYDSNNDYLEDTRTNLFPGYSIKEIFPYQSQYPCFALTHSGQLLKCDWNNIVSVVDTGVTKAVMHHGSTGNNGQYGYWIGYIKADGSMRADYPVVTGQRWSNKLEDYYNIYENTGFKSIVFPTGFKDVASFSKGLYALGKDNKLYLINSSTSLTAQYSNVISIHSPQPNFLFGTLADGQILSKQLDSGNHVSTLVYSNVKKATATNKRAVLLNNDGSAAPNMITNNITLSNPSTTYMTMYDFMSGSLDNKIYGVGQYAQALNDLAATYTADPSYSTNYILIGDKVDYKVIYRDYENDPKYREYWTYDHNSSYFESSWGIASFNGKTLDSPVATFDKPGKYTINIKVRDNPKNDTNFDNYRLYNQGVVSADLYVHRLGVPVIKAVVSRAGSYFKLEATDGGSFDLDHISRDDRGIVQREWRWRGNQETAWHNERMVKLDCLPENSYYIQLRVKDLEGFWSDWKTVTIKDGNPPVAMFTIEKNPLPINEYAKIKDQSYPQSFTTITSWHWIVKKLNADGSIPETALQDDIYSASNNSIIPELKGYDGNVINNYSTYGVGTYRIYLRVKDSSGLWSDGGTDNSCNINNFYSQDLVVQETYKLSNFRVVKVRDLHLESYYYNSVTGGYTDKPMGVNEMAIDYRNFGGMVDGLRKGYLFEFQIDAANFNDDFDSIKITPHFYTCDSYGRDSEERDLYWENSYHEVLKVGEGGHESWKAITLDWNDRTITGANTATWRGSYLIPGTGWAVPWGTSPANAKASKIDSDIIVNFEIKGYKSGQQKYDYNLQQWPSERTIEKSPYKIGDVIRYSHIKSNLDDNNVILNRP